MICRVCFQSPRRMFFRAGVCEGCDPSAATDDSLAPSWSLANVVAVARWVLIASGERWVTEAEARDKGTTPSWFTIRERLIAADYPSPLPGADDCMRWIASLAATPEDRCSEYENALVVLARKGYVREDELPLAAGAYHAWMKTQSVKTVPDGVVPTGQWLGTPNERREIHGCQCTEIKPLGVNPEHPEWGARFLIRFTAASGHELVWFASEGGLFDPKVGETYDIKARVKKHDEYNGRRSTIVSHCSDAHAPPRTRKPKTEEHQ